MSFLNQVVSFSGGKDSTAMLLEMLDRGESIHSVIAFDTGWEFPAMLEHWQQVEKYTGIKIIRLYPKHSFDYFLFSRPIIARKGINKGKINRYGSGWPSPMRRWCTREKVDSIRKYLKTVDNNVSCIGFASDELHRANSKSGKDINKRYPLIEFSIDEKEALNICKKHGFNWSGLYDHFRRVSCFCCPLQRIGELRTLRKEYPSLWHKMLEMDSSCKGNNPGFRNYHTVHDLDSRFADEERQQVFSFDRGLSCPI